jgi:hypothetical protein
MKKTIIYTTIIGIIFTITSCEKILMEPNPETNNKAIFNEYVKLVKEKYAMLEFKDVDIDQLAQTIEPNITDNLSDIELFEKLGEITLALKDGHSDISIGEDNYIGYNFTEGYPSAFDMDVLLDNYIGKEVNPSMIYMFDEDDAESLVAIYGTLVQDNEIAYLYIPSWNVPISDDQIEKIFFSFVNVKGLIIDIRQNTGGDPGLATKFTSYLFGGADVYTGFERFKIGPGPNDFSDSEVYLKQANSDVRFQKPVVVLTDRFCYSASTTFLYSVNPLANITTIGQRSGGGSGSVADGFLANGWKWSLSTSEFIDHLGNHLDNGIDPDISVSLDTSDTTQDEILERAILELQ